MENDDMGRLVTRQFAATLPGEVDVSADTDFFEVGGNSVLTARLVAALRSETGIAVSMREVFVGRTPARIAARMLDARAK